MNNIFSLFYSESNVCKGWPIKFEVLEVLKVLIGQEILVSIWIFHYGLFFPVQW